MNAGLSPMAHVLRHDANLPHLSNHAVTVWEHLRAARPGEGSALRSACQSGTPERCRSHHGQAKAHLCTLRLTPVTPSDCPLSDLTY